MPDDPKRLPSARMIAADTDEFGAEDIERLRRQAYGVIGGSDPLALPLAPEPTGATTPGPRPRVPLPGLPPLTGVDDGATVPVALLEPDGMKDGTPPPLPPSPASAAAEVWLEDAVTRPSLLSDIAGSMGAAASGPSAAVAPPAFAAYSLDAAAARTARLVLFLTSTTTFIVGLILGALLFRGR